MKQKKRLPHNCEEGVKTIYWKSYFIYIARIKSVQSSNVAKVSDSGIIPGIIPNLRIIFIG